MNFYRNSMTTAPKDSNNNKLTTQFVVYYGSLQFVWDSLWYLVTFKSKNWALSFVIISDTEADVTISINCCHRR